MAVCTVSASRMQERNHRLRVMLQAEERKVLEEFEGVVEEAEARLIAQVHTLTMHGASHMQMILMLEDDLLASV